jgi:hypothetical protein
MEAEIMNNVFSNPIVAALITLVVKGIIDTAVSLLKKDKLSKEATIASLRNQIYQIYDQCRHEKKISVNKFSIVNSLYDIYKKLGGNDFVEGLMMTINNLPRITEI